MSELDVVRGTAAPSTRQSLGADLQSIGVGPGMVVIVHVSLSALGWVCGGAVAVIQALLDAVGDAGTLVMPSHSGDLSDPASWVNPPVPRDWWQVIRDQLPAYDPLVTPTLGVGRVAEVFRRWPGAVRSAHPVMSFSARGPRALDIVGSHELSFSLGNGSPLARLHELDASVLLLGVGHDALVLMGNLVMPVSIPGAPIWRPYATAGLGVIHAIFVVPGDEQYDTDQDDLALNAGVGMMHQLNRLLGLRADVRYYHAFVDEQAGKGGYFEDYDFWDVSVGVTLQLPMQRWPDAW